MSWFMLMQGFSSILQLVLCRRQSEQEKDLEILLLRRQLAILERHHTQRIQVSRPDKLTLTVLASHLRTASGWSRQRLRMVLRIVQPKRSSNGIASWCDGCGHLNSPVGAGVRALRVISNSLSCAWHATSQGGAMPRLKES
jgi:hypothetical protein